MNKGDNNLAINKLAEVNVKYKNEIQTDLNSDNIDFENTVISAFQTLSKEMLESFISVRLSKT